MKVISYKDGDYKKSLDLLYNRPACPPEIETAVAAIVSEVRRNGDQAICKFMKKFDSLDITPAGFRVTEKEFEEVFRYYYRPLFLFAYGYVMDEGEEKNIVQSVFTEMWEKRKNLPENLNLKAYLYSSVKHACLRYFRRLQLLDEYKKRQAEALVLSFADDDVEDDRELVTLVQKALSQLSEQQRRIVELHVMEGKKYLEIADLLQLSENTVRTHLKRAYKILRENLSCLVLDIFF